MSKLGRGGAVAVILVLVIGAVAWRSCRDDSSPSGDAKASATRAANKQRANAATWLAQSGVDGRRIAGIVVDAAGQPLAGASVHLTSKLTVARLRDESVVTTDASGRFDFGAQPATPYVVLAERTGLTGAVLAVDLRKSGGNPPADQLRLVLHACEAAIHGTVQDSAGGIIEGARISRSVGDAITNAGVATDANGRYELCVPPGGAVVTIQADGYAIARDNVYVFGRTPRDFVLMPGTSVSGRVVRADDGSPVAGALVELGSAPGEEGVELTASSDADGKFTFDSVEPGRHLVRARAERLASAHPVDVMTEVGAPAVDVVCELTATHTIAGKVVDRSSGKSIADAQVQLHSMTRPDTPLVAISQPDGSFVVDHVFPGKYMPFVRNAAPPTEGPQTIEVKTTDVTGVVIEVERGATISGRILHGGKPVDGARVQIFGTDEVTLTNADGAYTLRGVPAGTHQVYAESHRVGAFTRGPPITVAANEDRKGVDLELDLSGSISGIVVDQNGAPVPGVFVRFSLLRGTDFGVATTDDDGRFTARALSGGGDYIYEVRERDGSALKYLPLAGKRFPPIAVADGRTAVKDVRIQIRREQLVISGRVVDADGKPVPDTRVRAMPAQLGWWRVPTGTSDASGAFTITELPSGTYELHASGARGDVRMKDVSAGRTDVTLRLEAFGSIAGTLEGFSDRVEVSVMGSGGYFPAAVTGSTFSVRNVPAGDYRIMAISKNMNATASVTVSPGKTANVTLSKPTFGIVEGTVRDEKTRAAVPNLTCGVMARVAADEPYYGESARATTDTSGGFRMERVRTGSNVIRCAGAGFKATTTIDVRANQVARVELVARAAAEQPPREMRDAGMTLETKLDLVMVTSVKPGGAADRAGITVGDVVLEVDGTDIPGPDSESVLWLIQYRRDGKATLELERGDKTFTVTLTLDPAPPPAP